MKHYFVINPAAGQGEARSLISEIDAVCSVAGIDYEIYETKGPGDGERFVRACCEEYAGRAEGEAPALRFYACGGDGTLNEVVNGAFGFGFTEIGSIPAGSGNDFIRNYPGGRFDDLIAQIRGKSRLCDLIHYEGDCDGMQVSRYCVNMFNIGFDSNVVDMMARMKRLPLMAGSFAYLVSIAAMLIEKKGADLRVEYISAAGSSDDPAADTGESSGFVYDGKLLLIAVANGRFCGGGIKGLPRAALDDGVFDVSLIRDVPRHTFIRLFPKYMKGTHLSEPRLENVIRYTRETSLTISPNRGTMKLCVDGEITNAGPIRFECCPLVFRFIVP